MLEQNVIEENKQTFINIINSIEREFNKEYLLNMLEQSDFYYAPASAKFHGSYPGGLCEHCLDVYDNLKMLSNHFPQHFYTDDTLKIVALFHDISKINLYKKDIRNKKVYHEDGTKRDNLGKFDWISEEVYAVDHEHKFIYGNHEETSEFLLRQYIPLTIEESVSILYHHGGMGFDSVKSDLTAIYKKYPLVMLLHTADLLGAFINQDPTGNE